MSDRISTLFEIRERFLRSAHLERDFYDPAIFAGYIATDFVRSSLSRITEGLKPSSGHRAWRMTGDYGSGKSSFALLLAHCFAGRESNFPPQVRTIVDHLNFSPPHFVPVLVTCARQSLGKSIVAALSRALRHTYSSSHGLQLRDRIDRLAEGDRDPADDDVLRLLLETNSRIILDSKGKGLLLILDELGKYLEYAALRPEREDVFVLQRLAESASRSRHEPLFVVSILHQGFDAYADRLTQSAQREWEKVAGRFEEIVFDQPIDQIIDLIASALNVRTSGVPKGLRQELARAMDRTIALGWFGSTSQKRLSDTSDRLYPLHPTVLPILIRTFRRFGQNERSIFSFLLSNEPFGLRAFSDRPLDGSVLYRLHDFYDYVRTNFGHRLAAQSYRSHWNLIDSIIDSFGAQNELELKILKTVGILNLLNDSDLVPSEETLVNALTGFDISHRKQIHTALAKLHRTKRVLYDRGRTRGFCLWPHTSVDLEKAYDEARRAVGTPRRVAAVIKDHLETRPIVARRHYIETGNLRHWVIKYCSIVELPDLIEQSSADADGVVLAPLCETGAERAIAVQCAKHLDLTRCPVALLAISHPLNSLVTLVQEVQRWEWIAANTSELNGDKYAREEVSRQKAIASAQLKKRIDSFVGFRQTTGDLAIDWFHQGKRLNIVSGRQLLETLSDIFDRAFSLAPCVQNELVNRRSLSSAAAAARTRLIERMFTDGDQPFLGMDSKKKPPEMSMYLSVLCNAGLHQRSGSTWKIDKPDSNRDVKCRLLPVLRKIDEIVRAEPDKRINVVALFDELRRPPYGVRDGILPLFLTVFAISQKEDIAFYKDGTFVPEVDANIILELTKAPSRFEVQYCRIQGLRADVFRRLSKILEIGPSRDRTLKLLGVVKQLCAFVAQLPLYVHNTKRMLPIVLAVRDCILTARDPAKLLFADLPMACGQQTIPASGSRDTSVRAFVMTLSKALADLRTAFPKLEDRLRSRLREAFDMPGSFSDFRRILAARAANIVLVVTEAQLKAFCLRLMDSNLPDSDWLESLGSYLALKPPSKWHDAEEDTFSSELPLLAAKFHRVENIVFATKSLPKDAVGIRIAVTQSNGVEQERVIHFTVEEERRLRDLQRRFEEVFARNQRLGLAAASRAIWAALENGKN